LFAGWPKVAKTKTPQASWRPAAIGLVKVLSQPQVRAYRPKPIKEILAAGCVVHLLAAAVHEAKVAEPGASSSRMCVLARRTGVAPVSSFKKCFTVWCEAFRRQIVQKTRLVLKLETGATPVLLQGYEFIRQPLPAKTSVPRGSASPLQSLRRRGAPPSEKSDVELEQ
jgi:hypothetical protein